jgi:hypothetical protein
MAGLTILVPFSPHRYNLFTLVSNMRGSWSSSYFFIHIFINTPVLPWLLNNILVYFLAPVFIGTLQKKSWNLPLQSTTWVMRKQ